MLQAMALVNEACLELVDRAAPGEGRGHFFGATTRAMRCILVDHVRGGRLPLFAGPRLLAAAPHTTGAGATASRLP